MAVTPITRDDVLAFAPELSNVATAAFTLILAHVNELDLTNAEIGETEDTTRLARIYLAAHVALITRNAGSGAAGPVTSESIGQIRRSFGLLATAAGTNFLSGTQYGTAYLALLQASMAHFPITA